MSSSAATIATPHLLVAANNLNNHIFPINNTIVSNNTTAAPPPPTTTTIDSSVSIYYEAPSINFSTFPSSSISFNFNFQQTTLVVFLSVVIVVVIIGNTLVIASVITTRRLRTITNCFIMSLAVADWLVGIFVMPPAVAYLIMEKWELGWILCDIWVSLDILLCTASILSLCAISVDRYLAVTQPLRYSRNRRSKTLALWMILVVWISSALITAPPMFGWYESSQHDQKTCRYNKNTGYVIFSAMGSFFIPMVVMLYVYVKISCVIAQRHDQLSHMDVSYTRHNSKQNHLVPDESDIDRVSSETEDCVGGGGVGVGEGGEGGNPKCSKYYRQMQTCSHIIDGAPNTNNTTINDRNILTPSKIPSSRLLRNNMSFSFENHHEPLTPVKNNTYRSSLPNKSKPDTQLHADTTTLNYEPASRVSSFRRESKTAQTLSIVMGGFILCWLPFFIFYLLTPFVQVNETIMQYFTWLGWINSAINPFIYAFYSADFRIAFWRLTVKRFKNSPPTLAHIHNNNRGGVGGGDGGGILNISMKQRQKRGEMGSLMGK